MTPRGSVASGVSGWRRVLNPSVIPFQGLSAAALVKPPRILPPAQDVPVAGAQQRLLQVLLVLQDRQILGNLILEALDELDAEGAVELSRAGFLDIGVDRHLHPVLVDRGEAAEKQVLSTSAVVLHGQRDAGIVVDAF